MATDAEEIAALNELVAEQRRMLRSIKDSRQALAASGQSVDAIVKASSPPRVIRNAMSASPSSPREAGDSFSEPRLVVPRGGVMTSAPTSAPAAGQSSGSSRAPFVASSGWYAAELERLNDELTISRQRASLAEGRALRSEMEAQALSRRVQQMEQQVEEAIRGRAGERDHILEMQHALLEQRAAELVKANAVIEALSGQLAAASYQSGGGGHPQRSTSTTSIA